MLKRIVVIGLTFMICGFSLCVSAQESVKFFNKNNIQINEVEDSQPLKVEWCKDGNAYVVLYSDGGRISTIKNVNDGEVFISKGTKNIAVIGFDKSQDEMCDVVTFPVLPNDTSDDEEENFISVADARNNAKAIYSLTTDDGYAYTTAFLDKKFNDYELKGTMGLVTGWIGNEGKLTWEQAEKYVNRKDSVWGVANHTKNHLNGLGTLTDAQLEDEIGNAKAELKKHFPNERILAVWTPGGQWTDSISRVVSKHHLIGRRAGGGATHNYLPMIKEELTYLAVYGVNKATPYDVMKGWADNAVSKGQWLVEMWHGVGDKDAASWNGNISETDATAYLLYISKLKKEGKMWVATVDEVAAYTMEKMESRISVLEKTDEKIRFTLTNKLDDTVYYEPLTANITLPQGWDMPKVTQGNVPVSTAVNNGVLTINIKPNSGEIIIKK